MSNITALNIVRHKLVVIYYKIMQLDKVHHFYRKDYMKEYNTIHL